MRSSAMRDLMAVTVRPEVISLAGGLPDTSTFDPALFARLMSEMPPAAALQYGAFDLSGRTPGGRLYADEFFIDAYVGAVDDRTNPDISPIFGDLHGLPPALLSIGTKDLLLEDSLAMAMRLSAAGGEVDLRVYPESPHGFLSFPIAMATAANDDIESWLAERCAG